MGLRLMVALGTLALMCTPVGAAPPPADPPPCRDELCARIDDEMEHYREDLGSSCGTGYVAQHARLLAMGSRIAPHLERALADHDAAVAGFAALLLVELGEEQRVLRLHCPARDCTALRQDIARIARVSALGAWTTAAAKPEVRLTVQPGPGGALKTVWCAGGEACREVRARRAGVNLELQLGPEPLVLRIGDQALHGTLTRGGRSVGLYFRPAR